jgi:hypothetical protein
MEPLPVIFKFAVACGSDKRIPTDKALFVVVRKSNRMELTSRLKLEKWIVIIGRRRLLAANHPANRTIGFAGRIRPFPSAPYGSG